MCKESIDKQASCPSTNYLKSQQTDRRPMYGDAPSDAYVQQWTFIQADSIKPAYWLVGTQAGTHYEYVSIMISLPTI